MMKYQSGTLQCGKGNERTSCSVKCNVPTLGHHHSAEIYDDQSSQMDVIVSTRVFERHCGVQLSLMVSLHSNDFHDFDYFEP